MIKIGLFEKLFPKKAVNDVTGNYFQTLTAYQPRFTSYNGGIYEALMCRSAIHTFASHCSKLKIDFVGNDKNLHNILSNRPNPWQSTSQFIYRVATILETDTTAFIVPIMDKAGERIVGFYPIKPTEATVVEKNGREYFVFSFPGNRKSAIEGERVGVLTKFQYESDLFGDGNRKPLMETLQMLHAQEQGTTEAIKSSAVIRFIATLAGTFKESTIKEEREKFANFNLGNNGTGVMIVDEKYKDIKPIESKAMLVDANQLQQIKNNIYTYFGANEKVLMNDYNEEAWNAYYEGKVEPFAIQLSEVLTNMIYSIRELAFGNKVVISSNRLEYASNSTKIQVVTQMFDRGMMTANQAMEVFHMPPIGEDGDKHYIRKEYAEVSELTKLQHQEVGEPIKSEQVKEPEQTEEEVNVDAEEGK